ncbi:MAG: YdbL family protein [Alphaproteobacteria bacterium]
MRRSRVFVIAAAVIVAVSALAAMAADSLDALRAKGVVAERFDGYVMVRGASADASVKATVDAVNAKRRSIYEKRAGEQGVPADQVGKVYAAEVMQNAPAGTWFLTESGTWIHK